MCAGARVIIYFILYLICLPPNGPQDADALLTPADAAAAAKRLARWQQLRQQLHQHVSFMAFKRKVWVFLFVIFLHIMLRYLTRPVPLDRTREALDVHSFVP